MSRPNFLRTLPRQAHPLACIALVLAFGCSGDDGPGRAKDEPSGDGDVDGNVALDPLDASMMDGSDPAHPGQEAGVPDAAGDAEDAMIDGGADGGVDAGGDPLTFAEYCPTLIDAVCEWVEICRGATRCRFGPFNGDGFCENVTPLVESGALAFDNGGGRACLQLHDVPASLSECGPIGPPPLVSGHGFGPMPEPNACTGFLRGAAALGEDCYPNAAYPFTDGCADGYCLRAPGECPGTCTAFAAEGDPCGGSVRCAADLYCSAGSMRCERYRSLRQTCSDTLDQRCDADLDCDEVCVARPGEGASCDELQCATGLVCGQANTPGAPPICVKPRGLGQACTIDAGCNYPLLCIDIECSDAQVGQGDRCVADENCPAGHTCQGQDAPSCELTRGDGATCADADQCAVGRDCTAIPSDATLRCYALGAENDECGPRSCGEDLYCANTGRCAPLLGDGEACEGTFSDCAAGLYCMADGQCHPPGDVGESCEGSSSTTCRSGLFCDRATQTCAEPVGENELCHPYAPISCQAGLYCDCPEPCSFDASMAQPEQRCRAKLADDSACTRSEQCTGGLCNGVCKQAACLGPVP